MDLDHARKILNVAHSAFVSIDEQGLISYWNIRAEEIFGLTREQALGRSLADTIIPESQREAHREGLRRFLASGEGPVLDRRIQLTGLRADGSEFPTEVVISALAEKDGWSFHSYIIDISERVAAEEERQMLLEELQRTLRGSEQRLEVIVNSLAEAITIRGLDNRLIYANQAALDRLDYDSAEQLAEADPRALTSPYGMVGEDGGQLEMEDLPSVRLLRGEQPEPLMLRSLDPRTNEERWSLLKATPVLGDDGQIEAAVTIIEDVTATKRASLKLEFLARAGEVLASSLDYQQTLSNVAGLAVPSIADWCALDLFSEDGQREPVAVAHIDPAKLEMAARLRAYEPEQLNPDQGVGRVWTTGQPLLYTEIPDELLAASAVDDEHLRLLRAVGFKAALIVPMSVQGRTIGALTMVSSESGRSFDESDLAFAAQIASRAALAVENSRLYSERSEIARTLQDSLLPEALPELPDWEIAALYRPAGQENEVGGDFYDFWEVGEDLLMIIGDVTGKGARAAAATSLVRHAAWTASEFDPRPAHVLQRVNAAMRRRPSLSVCTALCLRISGAHVTVASGGHPLPLRLGEEGVIEVGEYGTLLGAFAEAEWPEHSFTMQPGETLVAITDGVTDTIGSADERFGATRLKELLGTLRKESPMSIRERLITVLEDFQVGAQADDTATVILRLRTDASGSSRPARISSLGAGV